MLNDVFEMDTEPHVPEVFDYIPEGITVYDVNDLKVGTVKYFQPPSTTHNPSLDDFPPEFRTMSMPDELILRLLNTGFVRVNVGFLAKDRYVFLSQIHHITDDAVRLRTSIDNLVKA
jgi:hypothetical protein